MDNSPITNHRDFDRYIEHLLQGKQLTKAEILNLCEKAKEILSQEPNIRYVSSPVTICGNINGQFEDLLELFQVSGKIPEVNYLFLGNYAHRGWNGVSTISLLLAYKVRFKERITLLRGIGENRYISQTFGFYDECLRKYGDFNVWKSLTDVFDYLPLVAIVENAFFCVHSGLSPEIEALDQIKSLNRSQETPSEGPLNDFLWSEPGDGEGWHLIPRAPGYYFSQDITRTFLHINNLKMLCRGHQYVEKGYYLDHGGFVTTICSAPDYIGQMKNPGAVFELDDSLDMKYITFEAASRPLKQASRRAPGHFVVSFEEEKSPYCTVNHLKYIKNLN